IKKMGRVGEIIHRSIPYGTVLFIFDSENVIISCSEKRISNSTAEGLVVDKIISTNLISNDRFHEYLDGFDFTNFRLSNLRQFNSSIIEKIVAILSLQRIGCNSSKVIDPIEKKGIIDKIVFYEEKIDSLRRERSEEHTSELQSRENLVCRLLLEKKKKKERT